MIAIRLQPNTLSRRLKILALTMITVIMAFLTAGCSATTIQIIPTERPTISPTFTVTPSSTPDANATPTASPSPIRLAEVGGATPTPLMGPTRTPVGDEGTPTRSLNPNAPRIEFFTADSVAVAPGSSVNLFWSTRGSTSVTIYRLDRTGARDQVWNNQPPDGRLTVSTRERDRGQLDFLLIVGEGALQAEQRLSIPLACPVQWFFGPPPEECPNDEPETTLIIEQEFQRGRMVYLASANMIYVLFNDGLTPAWITFQNLYDPAIHPEMDENFPFLQPIARLGFVWRGNDTVRNRLGLALAPEVTYDGFVQRAALTGGGESLYISSTSATVLQLLPGGASWQIITSP